MICDRARRLFGACWDDELTQAERDGFESHLASCPRCRTAYDEFSRALELMASLPRIEASADLMDRVLARSRRTPTAPDILRESGARWVPVALTAAGAALVVAAVLVGSNLQWRAPVSSPPLQMVVTDGPREPVLVPDSKAKPEGRRPEAFRGNPENLFDPDKNVEFILDPVQLHRGRATVNRRPDAEEQKAIITF
jgi:anti-sigma factor RsiW